MYNFLDSNLLFLLVSLLFPSSYSFGFFVVLFQVHLNVKFDCLFELFLFSFSFFFSFFFFFLEIGLYAMNFPLRIAFPVSYRFWTVVFSFSFVSKYLLISSLILLLTHSLLNNVFLAHVCVFQVSSCDF